MKLRKEFLTKQMGENQVMISADQTLFSGVATSNSTAAFIIDCLRTDTTVEEITDKLWQIYDAPREVIEKDVIDVIEKLKSINSITE